MGTWYKKPRPVDVHIHTNPPDAKVGDVIIGDRYQCECGQVFEVIVVTPMDIHNNHLTWKRVYAPGVMEDARTPPRDYGHNGMKCW